MTHSNGLNHNTTTRRIKLVRWFFLFILIFYRLCYDMISALMREGMRRVVVTGLGVACPLGCSVSSAWNRLLEGAVATVRLTAPEYASIPCKVAAPVPRGPNTDQFDPEKIASKSERRYLSPSMLFALHAAKQALEDANWVSTDAKGKERTGVCLGMGMVDLDEVLETGADLKRGYTKVSPFFIPRILPNLAAGHVSIRYGFEGPNHCVSTACTTGLHAIGDAFRFIVNGDADVMVCGGTEAAINPLSIAAFARMRALSTSFNETPEKASRPFDKARDGFVMGEGAGILILEELSHAKARNATIHAQILGYGLSADANHITSPSETGRGAYLCMQRALAHTNIAPDQIGYINCHATSTPLGDKVEAKAIRRLMEGNVKSGRLAVSSTKGAIGHLLGAAGAVESVFTVLACKTGNLPLTANLFDVDEEMSDLNVVRNTGVKWDATFPRRIAVKNSFGFGGTNASLCLANYVE